MLHAESKKHTLRKARRAAAIFESRFESAVGKLTLNKSTRAFLHAIVTARGIAGHLPLSNIHVRLAATAAMAECLLKHHDENLHDPDFQHWMGTFCFDDGVTSLDDPNVDLRRIWGKIDKVMRECDLHGIYLTEVDIMLPLPPDAQTQLLFHIHMVCWRRDRKLKPRKLAKQIMKTSRFPNCLGARSVVFSRKKRTREYVGGLAYYLTKMPASVKKLEPDPWRPGKNRLRNDPGRFSPKCALRLCEVLSHIHIYDAVRGVGEGKLVRKAWKKRMLKWDKSSRGPERLLDRRNPVKSGWANIWIQNPEKAQRPCRIRM